MGKNKRYKWQGVAFALFWFVTGIFFVMMLSTTVRNHSKQNIKDIVINLDNGNHPFVTEEKIEDLLKEHFGTNHLDIPYKDINLFDLEWQLGKNYYVEQANFYIDMKDIMHVNVTQKQPLIRIISDLNNRDYYISKKGDKLPVSLDYTARVLVATGNIMDNNTGVGKIETDILWDLYHLAQYISENEILNALTEQIHIDQNGEIEIIPKVGNFKIKLGKAEHLDKKLLNILVFYKEGLPQIGWDVYDKFNFSYTNQIISSNN